MNRADFIELFDRRMRAFFAKMQLVGPNCSGRFPSFRICPGAAPKPQSAPLLGPVATGAAILFVGSPFGIYSMSIKLDGIVIYSAGNSEAPFFPYAGYLGDSFNLTAHLAVYPGAHTLSYAVNPSTVPVSLSIVYHGTTTITLTDGQSDSFTL